MPAAIVSMGLAAFAAAGPAASQSSNELSWAITNCLANIENLGAARQAFERRGYAYELEDYGIGPEGLIYWHTSPDRAVTVGVNIQPSRGSCTISPEGMTVGQAVPFAKSAAETVLKTPFKDGSPQGGPNITPASSGRAAQAVCSGAWAKTSGGLVHVTAGSQGQDPACAAALPAQIIVRFTKG